MRTIYVDYSQKSHKKQGIALIELFNGTPIRFATIRTEDIKKPSVGEMRGVILALKELKSTGGTIMTDQLEVVKNLLTYGELVCGEYTQEQRKEFNSLIKNGGFVIQHSKAHNGTVDPLNQATDQLAKLSAGIRCFQKNNEFGKISNLRFFNKPTKELIWRAICG